MSIKINLNIFLFAILYFLTSQFEVYALVMIFALLHELGHLICGIILGFHVKSLKIMPLGFSVEFYTCVEDYNFKVNKSNLLILKKILISFAGPMINVLLIIISFIFNLSENIIFSNLLILTVNLIPIYPLDGGRLVRYILKLFFENKKAYKFANIVSNCFSVIIILFFSVAIVYYKNIAIFFAFIFILVLILNENKRYNTYRKIYKTIDKHCTKNIK